MKLLHVLTLRLSAVKAVVIAFWAVLFYFAIVNEINDETDDVLEDHAEMLIRRALAGESLPESSNGTNNQFYLHEVSAAYAATRPRIWYKDSEVYIKDKNEYEPARIISYIYNDDKGRLFEMVVFTPTIDKDDMKKAFAYWLAALYAGMVLCIVIVNIRTLRKSMRPLQTLLDWLDGYRLGQQNRPLDIRTDISEFRKLGDTALRNMQRNEQLYELQKRFIANASHEMQTPLAVIQSRLEFLLEDGTLSEQQMGDIVKTLHTLKNLTRTNRSLLLLCKIDNGQFADTTRVDLGKLIRNILPDMEMIYANRKICVSIEEHGHAEADMNESLAATLVSNLLKNAFVHNVNGGRIIVNITPSALTVANTGTSEPLDGKRIFERFYHAPHQTASTGLGLSITQAICRLYGMRITYRFDDGTHSFNISLTKGYSRQ